MRIKLKIFSQEVFKISLITYLILVLAETVKEGFVSYFFNINILLIIVSISGLLMILLDKEEKVEVNSTKLTANDWEYFLIVSIASGLFVYFNTEALGNISLILTLVTSVSVFAMSYLLKTDN